MAAFVDRDVGVGVVLVAASGVDGAAGEDAVAVAEGDEVAHPGGWVVLVDLVGASQVQDGFHDQCGVSQPSREQVRGQHAESLAADSGRVGVEVVEL